MAARLSRCSLGKDGVLHPAGWAAKRGLVIYTEEFHLFNWCSDSIRITLCNEPTAADNSAGYVTNLRSSALKILGTRGGSFSAGCGIGASRKLHISNGTFNLHNPGVIYESQEESAHRLRRNLQPLEEAWADHDLRQPRFDRAAISQELPT